ncbi:MAG: hypothetical protein [Bacteriophage sp.]|nr:MAG: hypothetical protein [Bacteriophage sp.]
MNIKLVSPRMQMNIEDDSIYLYIVDNAIGQSIVIPMSYCAITNIFVGYDFYDDVDITLSMKDKVQYIDSNLYEDHDRHIKFEDCFHKTVSKILSCRFEDGYLARTMMRFLLAVETINYEYLELHGDNIVAIKEVSTTVRFTEKAKKIIGKIVAQTNEPEPVF